MARPRDEQLATTEQLAELRALSGPGEEVPDGIRVDEAAQRITELKAAQ